MRDSDPRLPHNAAVVSFSTRFTSLISTRLAEACVGYPADDHRCV